MLFGGLSVLCSNQVAEHKSLVRMPDSKVQRQYAIDGAAQKLLQTQERPPCSEALAETLGLATDQVRSAQLDDLSYISLYAPLEDSQDTTLEEVLGDPNQPLPDDQAQAASTARLLSRAIDQLLQREQYIIQRYFGLDGCTNQTMHQIGKSLGLTRERVRQLIEASLQKLKTWLSAHHSAGVPSLPS